MRKAISLMLVNKLCSEHLQLNSAGNSMGNYDVVSEHSTEQET